MEGPVLKCLLDWQARAGTNGPLWARLALGAETVEEAMAAVLRTAPHVYFLNYESIKRTMTKVIGTYHKSKYSLSDFNEKPLPLDLPVVLAGKSGAGKTQFALAHFNHPLLMKHVEDLRKISDRTDGLVFDDMPFSSWSTTEVIILLSIELDRTLKARYVDIDLPENLPMIFTTTVLDNFFPRGRNAEERAAIDRRRRIYGVHHNLFNA